MTQLINANDDLKGFAELYVKVFNAEPWNDHWTVESAYGRLCDIAKSPHFVGVQYVQDGQVKGAIFGNCEHWYEGGMHYSLKEMFISNEIQGTGIGGMLLKELEKELSALNVHAIYLFTLKNSPADRFYKKYGFSDLDKMLLMTKEI